MPAYTEPAKAHASPQHSLLLAGHVVANADASAFLTLFLLLLLLPLVDCAAGMSV
jgi:hypothetical protein